MPLLRKLSETLHFLRYGATHLAEMRARVADTEKRQSAQEGFATSLYQALDQTREGLDQTSRELRERLDTLGAQSSQHQLAASQELAAFRQELAAARQEAAASTQALAADQQAARQELATVTAELRQAVAAADEAFRREAGWTRDQLGAFAAALDRVQRGAAPSQSAGTLPASAAAAEEGFYPALERQFRGTTEDIRSRLAEYRPWLDGLPSGPVGDLGCGRGEWLQLLTEWGLPNRGVDLNAVNVEQMRSLGLAAEEGDAVQWLQSQPEASFAALTAFHLVEHLPLGVLLRLVQEARRVLQPGGRLILETPNPENLAVATQTFWLDPTHLRPLPPALLELMVRHAGLEHEATLRLHPPGEEEFDIADATLRALMMQGRDYAVVARKPSAGAAA